MATILAVDDSTSVRKMLAYTLTQAGHQVSEAANGEEALAKAEAGDFELVITDVNMPLMDGISLVRALRAMPRFRHAPLLVMTTETAQDRKLEAREAGATGWIVKPFNPDQLLGAINRVLG